MLLPPEGNTASPTERGNGPGQSTGHRVASKRNPGVLIVGSYPPPFGGQSVHIQNLHAYLRAGGFTVNGLNTGARKDLQEEGIASVRSSRELLGALLSRKETRLVHVHVSGIRDFGKLLPVCLASFVRRFKVVVTLHSGNIEAAMQNPKPWERLLLKAVLTRVDRVICVNNTIRRVLSRWKEEDRLSVIPAFSFAPREGRASEELHDFIGAHDPLIVCVGFCEPVYGFDLAIRSVSELSKTHHHIGLIIMGDGSTEDRYTPMIQENRLEGHIALCGNLPHDVCLSVIGRASLFLRPTLYDGDAISVREALAMNVPVVASSTEFRPAGVEVFKNGDLEDMLRKITGCLKKNGNRRRGVESDLRNLEEIGRLYLSVMGGRQ